MKYSLKPNSKLLVLIVKNLKLGVGDGLTDTFHMLLKPLPLKLKNAEKLIK
jgi:hypothetical protein